ncbi:transcription factor bHLH18-like protein, partial [Tanacetum coccineum]
MDKASVLGDAIKYLKNLQEKVKALEEQNKKRSNNVQESVVFVKRYEVLGDGGEIISQDDQLPEIEARFSGKDVLIRVHCEKKVGIVEEILAEIEKLHLSVINTTALTFANYALDITVVATMDQEFVMTTKDLAKNLRIGLKRFM